MQPDSSRGLQQESFSLSMFGNAELAKLLSQDRWPLSINTGLIGPPGTGKTPFLKLLERRLESRPEVCVAYVDCRDLQTSAPEDAYRRVLGELITASHSVSCGQDLTECSDIEELKQVLQQYADGGAHVLLILDHVDAIGRIPSLSTTFLGAVRSLCSAPAISVVCASDSSLLDFADFRRVGSSLVQSLVTHAIKRGPGSQ